MAQLLYTIVDVKPPPPFNYGRRKEEEENNAVKERALTQTLWVWGSINLRSRAHTEDNPGGK